MPPRKVPASTTPTRHSSRAKRAPSHADDNYPSDVEEPVAKRSKVEKTSPKASKKGSTKKASTKSPKSPKKSSKKSPKATKRSISTKKSSKRSSKKAKSEDEDEDEDEDEKPLIELKEKEDEQPKKKKIKKEKKEQEQEQEQEEEQVEEEIINPIPTIKGHGVLLSFGSGDMSQLGLGDAENMRERKKPTLIQHALTSLSIVAVAAGSLHNAALTAEGDVYTWGCNDDSALGHDKDEWLPTKVEFPEKKTKIAAIACGASHTIALSTTGHIYTWGTYRDANGIMGYSDTMDVAKTPVQMEMDQLVVGIACGEHHDLCLTKKGDVYTWGDIGIGQRGSDRNKKGKLIPRRVLFTKVGTYNKPKIVGIFAGGATNFAVDSKGNVWAWGPNNYHQCGVPNKGKSLVITSPTPIPTLSNITHVACHTHHTLFLTNDGKVYSVGRGEYGRLGLGDQKERDTPTHITSLPTDDDIVTSIGVGESHSLAVTQSGKLYTWGYGDLLQLGTGVEEDVDKPTHITGAQLNGRHVLHAVGGSQHSIVLASQPTAKHPETKTSTSTSADTEKSVAPPPVADYVPPPADVQ